MSDDTEPTPERLSKAATLDEKGKIVDTGFEDFITDDSKLTKRMKDVLDDLFAKGAKYPINGDQFAAGRQLQSDWDLSGSGKIGAVDTTRDAVDGGQIKEIPNRAIDAQGRYRKAMKAVGHTHAHILCHILLIEEKLSVYGVKWCSQKSEKLAEVAAKEALRRALTDLSIYYYPSKTPPMESHHAPDYRPAIQQAS